MPDADYGSVHHMQSALIDMSVSIAQYHRTPLRTFVCRKRSSDHEEYLYSCCICAIPIYACISLVAIVYFILTGMIVWSNQAYA